MKLALTSATGLLAGWVVVAAVAMTGPACAQPTQPKFDPAHPFANIKTADQWVKKFSSGKPHIVPNDPWGNMTPQEFWTKSWQGQNIDHPYRSPASIKGSGGKGSTIRSPYPYRTADEQYNAWLKAVNGGTQHTRANLPDWSGDWQKMGHTVTDSTRISDLMVTVSNTYKPRYRMLLRGEWEGGHQWWPAEFCLPDGLLARGPLWTGGGTLHFMADTHMVLLNEDRPENSTRYVYTDGRGFPPNNKVGPTWYGYSVGFWDGDELVIYTKDIKRWAMTHGLPEFSDQMQIVERMKRFGDEMIDDITLYDPKAFAAPWHDVAIFKKLKDWTVAPATWNDCVSTNNIYMDAKGVLQEHVPGEAGYHDISDPRPWATAYKLWNEAHPKEAARWKKVFERAEAMGQSAKK